MAPLSGIRVQTRRLVGHQAARTFPYSHVPAEVMRPGPLGSPTVLPSRHDTSVVGIGSHQSTFSDSVHGGCGPSSTGTSQIASTRLR